MYKFSIWKFNDREIDQICALVKNYSSGGSNPIDRRTISRNVFHYATHRGLIQRGDEMPNWDGSRRWYVEQWGTHRYYPSVGRFSMQYDLPHEALWRLIEPMLYHDDGETVRGFSITRQRGWCDLNIYPATMGPHTDADLELMFDLLCVLASWNYIIFQAAGNIWQITRTPERAIRSES